MTAENVSTSDLDQTASRPGRFFGRDRTCLAAQELVSARDPFSTRVVVFDTRDRTRIASSRPRAGIVTPVRFERDVVIYRHWHHIAGEQELRLTIDATSA
jgi:hypothetical protein